ncbi:MAG TPA: tripartite tricarboxylate transporter substrate binding protein [Burkholderiales bacterium]|jgi:tripartite-type tricarboxylate transporter receptor subunit TctC|nr:tripartite tricarboxylate transporter substrate binding protein [Burkholderiales bacterium]
MRKILLAWVLFTAANALAQPYPSKPIRVAVAFPPGGPVDIIARLMGPKLGELLGQSIVVENVVGAGGNVAAVRVAKAAPDGYTVLAHSSAYAVNPTLIPNAGYDGEKDFIPLAIVASQPNLIVVHADFPAKTLAELLERARTGKLAFASAGNGTTPHLTGENLFKIRAKVDITHIPFKGGGPAAAAVLSGQPPIGSIAGSAPLPHIKAGKLRALAVSSAQRLAALPDVPTLGELGFSGMEDYTWVGFFVPAGTPAEVAQKLNDALLKVARDPQIKERLEALAFDVTAAPLGETAAYVKSELAKWGKVVRDVGAKVD